MKLCLKLTFTALAALCLAAAGCADGDTIDLRQPAAQGIYFSADGAMQPDSCGMLKTYTLLLPGYAKGVYLAQDSYYDYWQVNGNRVLPWYFTPATLCPVFTGPAYGVDGKQNPAYAVASAKGRKRQVSRHGVLMHLALDDGRYMALLPMAGPEAVSWLYVTEQGAVEVQLCTHGTEAVQGPVAALAWAVGQNANEACWNLFSALERDERLPRSFRLRYQKEYPEPFRYLGWCTWEEYKKSIDARIVLDDLAKLRKGTLPVRYAIVDDGHLSADRDTTGGKANRLSSFRPNEKFPDGFAPILAMRDTATMRWFGLWHNMNGYWGGFSPRNDFGERVNAAMRTIEKTGMYVPKNDPGSIATVYGAFLGRAADDGFDFLKVDWQAANLYQLNHSENAAAQAFATSRVVDDIAHERFSDGMINCMAMNNVVLLNTRYTNVTRVSIDYKLGNPFMAKEHLLQSYANALHMGQTVWGDHDMFHSSDPVCGRVMALSKALSGGPVYLSDAPERIDAGMVRPLCYADGELIRPLAPAAALTRSLFSSPINDTVAYCVCAPLANGAAAVAAYNLCAETLAVQGSVSAGDYRAAGTYLQPYRGEWEVPAQGLYLYDYFAGMGAVLDGDYSFSIDRFGDRYFLMLPVEQQWAVVGRADKYLAPATVSDVKYYESSLSFTLAEAGPVRLWSAWGELSAPGITFTDLGDGLWEGRMPEGERNLRVTVNRKDKE